MDENNEFVKLAEPVMKYLCENYHPHVTIIITGNSAELVEGLECHRTNKFIKD
jgi:hypothetical protein